MRITFWGHSACFIETAGYKLIVDPFLTGNPRAALSADEVQADFILVTHGHADHLGDAIPIARRTGATIIANYELANYCQKHGAKSHPMNHGGRTNFDFGTLELTTAHHSSSIEDDKGNCIYLGEPGGFVIESEGKTVYISGDTALTYDMRLIGEAHSIDLAILPIGANFTMGTRDANRAMDFLQPKHLLPVHYNTFPIIAADPSELISQHAWGTTMVHPLAPGESIDL